MSIKYELTTNLPVPDVMFIFVMAAIRFDCTKWPGLVVSTLSYADYNALANKIAQGFKIPLGNHIMRNTLRRYYSFTIHGIYALCHYIDIRFSLITFFLDLNEKHLNLVPLQALLFCRCVAVVYHAPGS